MWTRAAERSNPCSGLGEQLVQFYRGGTFRQCVTRSTGGLKVASRAWVRPTGVVWARVSNSALVAEVARVHAPKALVGDHGACR